MFSNNPEDVLRAEEFARRELVSALLRNQRSLNRLPVQVMEWVLISVFPDTDIPEVIASIQSSLITKPGVAIGEIVFDESGKPVRVKYY